MLMQNVGGQIRCVTGNVEVASWTTKLVIKISPSEKRHCKKKKELDD